MCAAVCFAKGYDYSVQDAACLVLFGIGIHSVVRQVKLNKEAKQGQHGQLSHTTAGGDSTLYGHSPQRCLELMTR